MKYEAISYVNTITLWAMTLAIVLAFFGCVWLYFMYITSSLKDSINFGQAVYNDIKYKYYNIFIALILLFIIPALIKLVFIFLKAGD